MGSRGVGRTRRRWNRRNGGRILGNLAQLGRRIFERRLLAIALGLQKLEMLPENVANKDRGTSAKVVFSQAAHLLPVHLEIKSESFFTN
jgi:hypothetical protein